MKTTRPLRKNLPVALIAGLGGLVTLLDANAAQPWAASDLPDRYYYTCVASSADGSTLLAAVLSNWWSGTGVMPIFLSTDAGSSWRTSPSPTNGWTSLTCSADGTRMGATAAPGVYTYAPPYRLFDHSGIFVSDNSGASWTRTSAPTNNWTSIASSADGKTMVAATAPITIKVLQPEAEPEEYLFNEGSIYRSLDHGTTWSRTTAPTNHWTALGCSADGRQLLALGSGGGDPNSSGGPGWIYRSSDSGQTWTQTSAPLEDWASVALSADGTLQMAAARSHWNLDTQLEVGGGLCVSTDSGVTWEWSSTPPPGITSEYSAALRCTADGRQWFLNSDQTYTSRDSGRTWEAIGGQASATPLAVSADGYRIIAAGFNGVGRLPYSGPWRLVDLAPSWSPIVRLSPDGARIVTAAQPGILLTSTNAGTSWTQTSTPTPAGNLGYFTSSTDGTRCAVLGVEGMYSSTDGGATWIEAATPPIKWTALEASADGTRLAAAATIWAGWDPVANGTLWTAGGVYTSWDAGRSWLQSDAPDDRAWSTIACSADGSQWLAGSQLTANSAGTLRPAAIYRSTDAGAHWKPTSAPDLDWSAVAVSPDGTLLLAGGYRHSGDGSGGPDGGIYRSLDSGGTWTLTSAPTHAWGPYSLASTADGRQWVASMGRYVFISTDFGETWRNADAPAGYYGSGSVAASADGKLILAFSRSALASLHAPAPEPSLPPSPRLIVGVSGPDLGLSWLIPSTRSILQQTAALGSGRWEDVPTPPVLELTNLHHRVSLTPSPGNRYFRLKQQ